MLRSDKGQHMNMMLTEAISRVAPASTIPSSTPSIMARDPIMPNMTVASSIPTQEIPIISKMAAPTMPVTSSMPTPDNTIPQSQRNPSCLGSIRTFPPTSEQVSLFSVIETQSKLLRILPDTIENFEARQEVLKQIQFCERALLESAGNTSDEQETNVVTIGASTSTPKTATVSLVTTKGKQEVSILLTSEGDVLRDKMGSKFFRFVFHLVERIFGNTIQEDWRKQTFSKKNQLFENVIAEFGDPGFNKESIMEIAQKYIHSKRDKLRLKLTKDLKYPRPAWITDPVTWDELIKDAKFKKKVHKNSNYNPSAGEGGKRRLRDTTKATQARLSSFGSHRLGSGGYNNVRGSLVRQFEKEASKEDLKYALLHGSQGLRQHMLDRGEKLVIENQREVAQKINSSTEEVDSEHEEVLEAHDGSSVAHNESITVPEPPREYIPEYPREYIPEFQQRGEWDNNYVQHDEQATTSIRLLPSQKWIKRKRTVFHYASK